LEDEGVDEKSEVTLSQGEWMGYWTALSLP